MAATGVPHPATTVKSGDLVCLLSQEEEEDCFISVSGSTEDKCSAKTSKDKDTIFQIIPMTQYTAQEALDKRQKKAKGETKDGKYAGQEQSDLESLQLENERNEALISQLAGKEIIYGQIIQLVHKRTHKYFCSKEGLSDDAIVMAAETAGAVLNLSTASSMLNLEKIGSKRCWFKVVPAQKNRTEGEKVGPDDKVFLLNVVAGLFLHQTKRLDEYGNYELDLDERHNATVWKMQHSDVGGSRHRAVLRHGDAIRFFHEHCGYLYGTGDFSTLKFKYYHNGMNETVSSYKTIWLVESTDVDTRNQQDDVDNQHAQSNMEIHWNKPVRIRLFGTDHFLSVSNSSSVGYKNEDDLAAGAGVSDASTLVLTPNKEDINTVFHLVSPSRESDEIAFGSEGLVHCVASKDWIHMSEDALGYSTEMKGYTDSEVFCTKKYSVSNVLALKMIPKFQLDDYDFVSKRVPTLMGYDENVHGELAGASQTPEAIKEVTTALADLVKYLTISDNDNPFEREGTPILSHQRLLSKSEILDVVVSIARVGPRQDVQITQLAFRLLKQIVKHNGKLGIYLYKRMSIEEITKAAIGQIDYYKKVPVAQTFYEIFKDNSELLYSLTPGQVKNIFKLLDATRDYHYFELLSALTRYKGSVIHANQKIICLQLAETRSIIPQTRIAGGIVELTLDGKEGKWITLLDFVWNHRDKNAINLFFSLLKLYCDLCEDRNVACISIITAQLNLTFNECFTNLKEQQLEPRFRAVYCKILLHIFVDVFPQSTEMTGFKSVWYRVATKTGKLTGADSDADATTNQVYLLEEDPNAGTVFKYPKASNIQEFLLDYIFDTYAFRMDRQQVQTGQPRLLLQIMIFARVAFQFGIFKKKEANMASRLREILGIDPDRDHTGKPRSLGDELHRILIQIKHEVLGMLERLYDMQDNTFLAKEIKLLSKAPTEEMAKRQLQEQFLQKYSDDDITYKDPMELSGVLLRLLKHEDAQLTSRALKLLKRVALRNSPSAILLKLLPHISILTKKQDKEAHAKFETKLLNLQHLTSAKMRPANVESIVEILEDLTTACIDSSSHSTFQKMFLNMKVHEEIINIIRRPLELSSEDSVFEINRIIIKCYAFLREFCSNSKTNQAIMFSHIEFMINQLILYKNTEDVPEAIMQTIIAVFKDNHGLCRRVTERIVLPFINIIFETKRHSTYVYMDFFKTIIKPGGVIYKPNQNIVLKLLVSRKDAKDLIQAIKTDISSAPVVSAPLVPSFERKDTPTLMKGDGVVPTLSISGITVDSSTETGRKKSARGEDKDKDKRRKTPKKKTKGKEKDDDGGKEKLSVPKSDQVEKRKSLPPQIVKDLTPEQIREENRAGVISLLALCAEERNYFTEVTCQKLLGIDECIAICHRAAYSENKPANAYKIIEAFLHFIDEVYLNTESSVQMMASSIVLLPNNHLLWDLIKQFTIDIRQLTANPKSNPSYEAYLFLVICPFLQHFFAKFSLIKANQLHKAISNELLDNLANLRKCYSEERNENFALISTMKILVEAGIQGSQGTTSVSSLPRATRPQASVHAEAVVVLDVNSMSVEAQFFEQMNSKVLEQIVKLVHIEEEARAAAEGKSAALEYKDTTVDAEVTSEAKGKGLHRRKSEKGKGKKGSKTAIAHATFTSKLIEQSLRNLDYQTYVELIVTQIRNANVTQDFKLTRTCLRLVRQFVLSANDPDDRRVIQDRFAELDTPLSVIKLLRSPHPKVVAAASSALRSLLDEGYGTNLVKPSKKTLDNISQAFSSGGHQQFFEDILSLVQQSKTYLKEMKRRMQTLAPRRRGTIAEKSLPLTKKSSKNLTANGEFADEMVEMTIMNEDDGRGSTASSQQLIDPGRIVRDVYGSLFLLAQGYPIFKSLVQDIVRETVLYLKVYESIINPLNIDLAIQVFVTLKEVCKEALQNQQVVLASQVLIPVNRLLSHSFLTIGDAIKASKKGVTIATPSSQGDLADPDFYEKSYELKIAIVDFLFVMLEASDPSIVNEIVSGLNFAACTANTAILSKMRGLNPPQKKKAIFLASSTYRLVKMLSALDTSENKDLRDNLRECENYCASRIGTVEVMNNKELANIYFPIPTGFRPSSAKAQESEEAFAIATKKAEDTLTKKLETHFLKADINWGKSGEKVEELVSYIEEVLIRKEYKEQTYNFSRLWYYFVRSAQLWWQLSFAFGIVINILILAYATNENAATYIEFDAKGHPAIKVLGILQSIVTGLLMVSVCARRGTLRTRLEWKKKHPGEVPYSLLSWDQVRSRLAKGKPFRYFLITMSYVARDFLSIFSILYFAASILGNTVSPFFFAAHLLQLIVRSSYLKFAVAALTKNVVSIFLLLVMLFNGVYILSIFSYRFFQDQYVFTHDDGLAGVYCNSVWECMFTNLYYGTPVAGGLVQFLPAYDDPTAAPRGPWLAFQIIFFFYVGPIVLNLVLAVIVDTFGDLREKSKEGKDELANSCLICSIDRDAFQQRSKDFTKHLEKDHNRLHYLYFFAYLRERKQKHEVKQLSQVEKLAYDKIKANKAVEIFPIGRSIALETEEN